MYVGFLFYSVSTYIGREQLAFLHRKSSICCGVACFRFNASRGDACFVVCFVERFWHIYVRLAFSNAFDKTITSVLDI